MTFAHPLLLLGLLALPALGVAAAVNARRRVRHAVKFTNLELLAAVAGERRRPWRRYVPATLLALALAALVVGVARPSVSRVVPTERATVILVVDASGSMAARDVKPSRLLAAEDAVGGFLDRLPRRLRVGLVVFSSEPQVAVTPTHDRQRVRQSMHVVGEFPGGGATAIGDALATAVALGRRAIVGDGDDSGRNLAAVRTPVAAPAPGRATSGLVSILFLSDGA